MDISFYLDPKVNKVYISIIHNGWRIRKSLGISANKLAGSKIPGDNFATNKLTLIKNNLLGMELDFIRDGKVITKEDALNCLTPPKELPKDKTLFEYFDEFIIASEKRFSNISNKPLAPGTIRAYKKLKTILSDYQNVNKVRLTIESFDQEFYAKFRGYAYKKGKSPNSFGENIKILKTFCEYLQEQIPSFPNYFRKYKVIRTRGVSEPLKKEELKLLYEADLSGPYDKARWILLFLCGTGMRISDYNNFKAAKIEDDFIVYTTIKTNTTCYVPFIDDEFLKPKEIYLYLTQHFGGLPKISGQKLNEMIKEMALLVNIRRIVPTSKTGRKTYATYHYLRGVSKVIIRMATGHKTDPNFDAYVGIDKEDILKAYRKS